MKPQIISFKCLLKNKAGKVISQTFNKDVLTLPNQKSLNLQALSDGLANSKKGEKRVISLNANEAYGYYDPQKIILFPLQKLPKHLKVGQTVNIVGKSGQSRFYTVIQIHDNLASLDGNHPLAGQDLIFEIDILDSREATSDELVELQNQIHCEKFH